MYKRHVFKLYRILNWFDKWDYSYALVAGLSMMVFAPVIILRVFKKLAVQEYIYITACVFAVSYTHLDVYKRQVWCVVRAC